MTTYRSCVVIKDADREHGRDDLKREMLEFGQFITGNYDSVVDTMFEYADMDSVNAKQLFPHANFPSGDNQTISMNQVMWLFIKKFMESKDANNQPQ